eukprot:TRINITY_DN9085_c0_g1_i1.p1 TRINITY_DN9085_c0_g1~~TRINITY_DN9085_c0_g1_i1.p1  ORF type:complete len:119 (-),score=15.55 TRINITY_DN9085_c0_g1_i1:667-1023(-)
MIDFEVIDSEGKGGLEPLFLLVQHLVGLLVFLDELASKIIIFSLKFLFSLLADSGSLLQIFDLSVLESYGFFQGNHLSFKNAVLRCQVVCFGFEVGDCAFKLVCDVFYLFIFISSFSV